MSSIGAQYSSGVGPINGLHDVERLLNDAAENVTHLRPGFFFENLLWQLDSIKNAGRFSLPVSGSLRFPMIATRDIGRVAVQCLINHRWTGHSVLELHGAAELSFDDVAGILSNVLGRKIEFVKCEPQEMRKILLENALSENAADLMLEMYAAAETRNCDRPSPVPPKRRRGPPSKSLPTTCCCRRWPCRPRAVRCRDCVAAA